ncbi:hypothetical protein [Actinomadura flavalba]|uniref:hypothetical protein n=1 Tax=Actinomadura flavalba TaxID=1120938 RepID=UPI000378DCD2|nr:hypothetical protein [Actinomadura flavalba]
MALRRFFPSLDSLEDQVTDRAARPAARTSNFDHPTARLMFHLSLALTVVAHVAALVYFLVKGH